MLLGPVVGPIIGGFLSQSAGYKWVFFLLAILSGVSLVLGVPFLHETYAPVLEYRRALASEDIESAAGVSAAHSSQDTLRLLWISLTRPIVLLSRSLICFTLSLYMAL